MGNPKVRVCKYCMKLCQTAEDEEEKQIHWQKIRTKKCPCFEPLVKTGNGKKGDL
jgi:hypothetical protein